MFESRFKKFLIEDIGLDSLPPYLRRGSRLNNRKKNLRQVPDSHRTDPELNQKVETVRNNTDNKRYLNPADLAFVEQKYNIHGLNPGDSKQLGTTNIHLHRCPLTGQYYITK